MVTTSPAPPIDQDMEWDRAFLQRPPISMRGTILCIACVIGLLAGAVAAAAPLRTRIVAPVSIETKESVARISAPVSGFVVRKPIAEGEVVSAGATIGVIGFPAEVRGIELLRTYNADATSAASSRQERSLPNLPAGLAGGVLGGPVAEADAAIAALKRYIDQDPGGAVVRESRRELQLLQQRAAAIQSRSELIEQSIAMAERDVDTKRALLQRGYATTGMVNTSERALIDARLRLTEIGLARTELEERRAVLEQALADAQRTHAATLQALWDDVGKRVALLQAAIADWDSSHSLKAPVSGILRHFDSPKLGQFINAGADFAVIVPNSRTYVATITLPAGQARRISVGHPVLIALDAYPERDFGSLHGVVTRVSRVARSGRYSIEISVSSLRFSRGQSAIFSQGMPGRAIVYTSDGDLVVAAKQRWARQDR